MLKWKLHLHRSPQPHHKGHPPAHVQQTWVPLQRTKWPTPGPNFILNRAEAAAVTVLEQQWVSQMATFQYTQGIRCATLTCKRLLRFIWAQVYQEPHPALFQIITLLIASTEVFSSHVPVKTHPHHEPPAHGGGGTTAPAQLKGCEKGHLTSVLCPCSHTLVIQHTQAGPGSLSHTK